jgi:trk system potassium uptake protein TrkH
MAGPLRKRLARTVVQAPPPLVLAALYAAMIAFGTLGLMLPAAQKVPFGLSDAVFTAASAVTVTGLGVVDVAGHLTLPGQILMVVLIQLGGLGLMTFSVLVLSALGLPVGMTQTSYLREDLNQTSVGEVLRLVKVILRAVLVCELVGTILLASAFVPVHGLGPGLWHALFHAVSAFNNAGFSSLPDGLLPWAGDPIVNLSLPALFIIGGLGYGVLTELVRIRRWRRFSLHAKLMLLGTAVLILGSVLVFAALEWRNPDTLGPLGTGEKLLASWFQGVTPRTAGFNTVDIGAMEDSTTTLYMALMMIGAGPTSTGGGIKVTTIIVMLLATIAFFRRQTEMHAFGRSIALDQALKAMALTAISVVVVFTGIFLLTLSHQGDFIDIAFEVTSAFGTVGLSRGFTEHLDGFGRAVIVVIMFVGRVGPLTLGFFLATRRPARVRYPPTQVYLG